MLSAWGHTRAAVLSRNPCMHRAALARKRRRLARSADPAMLLAHLRTVANMTVVTISVHKTAVAGGAPAAGVVAAAFAIALQPILAVVGALVGHAAIREGVASVRNAVDVCAASLADGAGIADATTAIDIGFSEVEHRVKTTGTGCRAYRIVSVGENIANRLGSRRHYLCCGLRLSAGDE